MCWACGKLRIYCCEPGAGIWPRKTMALVTSMFTSMVKSRGGRSRREPAPDSGRCRCGSATRGASRRGGGGGGGGFAAGVSRGVSGSRREPSLVKRRLSETVKAFSACSSSCRSDAIDVYPSPGLLQATLRYPTATNDRVTVVEHGCLSRRHGKLRLMQHDVGPIRGQRLNVRRYRLMPVANLHGAVHCLGRRWAHPVDPLDAKCRTEGGVPRPHHDRVVRWIEARHIQRLGCRYAEATALPHGIKRQAMVHTDGFTGCIDHATWLRRCRG